MFGWEDDAGLKSKSFLMNDRDGQYIGYKCKLRGRRCEIMAVKGMNKSNLCANRSVIDKIRYAIGSKNMSEYWVNVEIVF